MVLVYGLPGSGKSTLLRAFCSDAGVHDRCRLANELKTPFEFHWFSYDEAARKIEARVGRGASPSCSAAPLSASSLPSLASWHQARKCALEYTRLVCAAVISGNNSGDSWNAAWDRVHEARVKLGVVCAEGSLSDAKKAEAGSAVAAPPKHVVLALDDNFYYRSMRFSFYRIAALNQASFAQLLLQVPVDEAVRRDAAREGSACVGEATIRRMDLRFEAPHSGEAAAAQGKGRQRRWEGHDTSAVVCTSTDRREIGSASTQSGLQVATAALVSLLARAKIAPPLRRRDDELSDVERADRERERRLCSKSLIHATDLALRKIVGFLMRRFREEQAKLGTAAAAAAAAAAAGAGEVDEKPGTDERKESRALWEALCHCMRHKGLDPSTAATHEVAIVLGMARKCALEAAKEDSEEELETLVELAEEEQESVETLLGGRLVEAKACALFLAQLGSNT